MPKKDGPPFLKEAFSDENYAQRRIRDTYHDEPHVMNGIVSFRKWRFTAELVEEPTEVLAERLQHLWDHTRNTHHWQPLRKAAASIGYELQGSPGSRSKR